MCVLFGVRSGHYVVGLNKRPAQDNVVFVCVCVHKDCHVVEGQCRTKSCRSFKCLRVCVCVCVCVCV